MQHSDNLLPNKIITQRFCQWVGIKCNGTSLHTFVEPALKDSSKWRNILQKGRPITEKSLERLIKALSSKRAKLCAETKKMAAKELKSLSKTVLWQAMQTNLSRAEMMGLKRQLPMDIQIIMSRKHEQTRQYTFLDNCPGSAKINNLEKVGTYDALAALVILLRENRGPHKNFEDAHVHRAAFRLLLSFFQTPSFFTYRFEIWQTLMTNVIRLNKGAMNRMGLGFWTMDESTLDEMIDAERAILKLAIDARIIQNFQEAPQFFYLLYRNEEYEDILLGLNCIKANQKVELMALDSFYYELCKVRKRQKNNLNYPSASFPHLAINQ